MSGVTAQPYATAVDALIWTGIVHDTLREALDREPSARPEFHAWRDDYAALKETPFLAVFTGILTTARRSA